MNGPPISPPSPSDSALSEQEQRLDQAIALYLEAVDAGEAPDRAEFLALHPDLAARSSVAFSPTKIGSRGRRTLSFRSILTTPTNPQNRRSRAATSIARSKPVPSLATSSCSTRSPPAGWGSSSRRKTRSSTGSWP